MTVTARIEEEPEGGYRVIGTIEQVQEEEPFEVTVPVVFETEATTFTKPVTLRKRSESRAARQQGTST